MANEKLKLRVSMPLTSDMELIAQDGGTIDLAPIFYGPAASGPHFVVMQGTTTLGKFKLLLKADGKLELKKAQ